MVKWAVKCATYYQNLFPNRQGYRGISPREALTGIKVDIKAAAPIAYGQFAYVREKMTEQESRTMAPRVFPGIALQPAGHGEAVDFLNLETFVVVRRDQFVVAQIPKEYQEKLNSMGTYDKESIPEVLGVEDEPIDDDNEEHPTEEIITNMTVEQASKRYGTEMAEQSLEKKFTQYLKMNTLRGVPASDEVPSDQIVDFKTFAKPKQDADGNMTTLKTRGVGGGDQQTPKFMRG